MSRSKALTTDLVGSAAVLSVVVTISLWLGNGGVADLDGPMLGATSLGRLTGLVAADLLLIQVLLMARLPWVERGFGQDRLARWHRWVGFVSFSLMLAHVVLVTLGYAGSISGFADELWDLTVNAPGMLLAAVGVGLLTGVVVTSIRRARRRLRYESWHLLHLYAYLGVGLAIPHQLWTGTEFTSSPAASAYWWSLYVAAAGAILVFRLGVPLCRSWYHRLVVRQVVEEAPGVVSVYLTGRHLDRLPVRAGQFFVWRFLSGPGWSRAHPYSLSAAPRADGLRITIKNLGDDSARAGELRPGTTVLFEGPFGLLTGEHYRGGPMTMFACGVGITPILALLQELPYPPGQATLVYRARSEDEVIFRDELRQLADQRGVRVVYAIGPRASDDSWLPKDQATSTTTTDSDGATVLQRLVPDIQHHDIYICGPDAWTASVQRAARALRVPRRHIHTERFTW